MSSKADKPQAKQAAGTKIELPDGFNIADLSMEQLGMLNQPEFLAMSPEEKRTALLEADKSEDLETAEGGTKSAVRPGFVGFLQNPTRRTLHERYTDTYWQPAEVRSLNDITLKFLPAYKLQQALKAGTLIEATMPGIAFGVAQQAPSPTASAPLAPVTAESTGGEEADDEDDDEADEPAADDTKIVLPEGFEISKLTAAQVAVVQDDLFAEMTPEDQKALLLSVGPPEASGPEQA